MVRFIRLAVMAGVIAANIALFPPSRLRAQDELFQEDRASLKAILSNAPLVTKSFTVDTDYEALLENLPDNKPARTRLKFELNSSRLSASAKAMLREDVAAALNDVPDAKVVVAGHTDTTGSDAVNLALSTKRAQAVADFLIKVCHLDATRFVVAGYGEMFPLEGLKGTDSNNRRVEFIRVE